MERAWLIISGLCVIGVAVFLLRSHFDAAFVTGALGCVAWFLSLRTRLRRANLAADEASKLETDYDGDSDED